MNNTNTTTIQQLTRGQGAQALSALTGAQIVFDDSRNVIRLAFSKMVGKAGAKFKTLEIQYNSATDLYDLHAFKLNRKTFAIETKEQLEGCYCDQLQEIVENITGLYLSF